MVGLYILIKQLPKQIKFLVLTFSVLVWSVRIIGVSLILKLPRKTKNSMSVKMGGNKMWPTYNLMMFVRGDWVHWKLYCICRNDLDFQFVSQLLFFSVVTSCLCLAQSHDVPVLSKRTWPNPPYHYVHVEVLLSTIKTLIHDHSLCSNVQQSNACKHENNLERQ